LANLRLLSGEIVGAIKTDFVGWSAGDGEISAIG